MANSNSTRRRRSRATVRQPLLRHPLTGRVIFVVMLALTVLHVAVTANRVRLASFQYGFFGTGMTPEETRYLAGAPARQEGTAWRYVSGTAVTTVGFGPDDRVGVIGCADTQPDFFNCPRTLGIGVSTTEDQVWLRLGRPSREAYVGGDKTIVYDELGLSFTLQKFQVARITLTRGSRAWWTRVARILIP